MEYHEHSTELFKAKAYNDINGLDNPFTQNDENIHISQTWNYIRTIYTVYKRDLVKA